jgi:hypothetical protein
MSNHDDQHDFCEREIQELRDEASDLRACANMMEDRIRALEALILEAHPHVCSLLCTSHFKAGEAPTHVDLCERLAGVPKTIRIELPSK